MKKFLVLLFLLVLGELSSQLPMDCIQKVGKKRQKIQEKELQKLVDEIGRPNLESNIEKLLQTEVSKSNIGVEDIQHLRDVLKTKGMMDFLQEASKLGNTNFQHIPEVNENISNCKNPVHTLLLSLLKNKNKDTKVSNKPMEVYRMKFEKRLKKGCEEKKPLRILFSKNEPSAAELVATTTKSSVIKILQSSEESDSSEDLTVIPKFQNRIIKEERAEETEDFIEAQPLKLPTTEKEETTTSIAIETTQSIETTKPSTTTESTTPVIQPKESSEESEENEEITTSTSTQAPEEPTEKHIEEIKQETIQVPISSEPVTKTEVIFKDLEETSSHPVDIPIETPVQISSPESEETEYFEPENELSSEDVIENEDVSEDVITNEYVSEDDNSDEDIIQNEDTSEEIVNNEDLSEEVVDNEDLTEEIDDNEDLTEEIVDNEDLSEEIVDNDQIYEDLSEETDVIDLDDTAEVLDTHLYAHGHGAHKENNKRHYHHEETEEAEETGEEYDYQDEDMEEYDTLLAPQWESEESDEDFTDYLKKLRMADLYLGSYHTVDLASDENIEKIEAVGEKKVGKEREETKRKKHKKKKHDSGEDDYIVGVLERNEDYRYLQKGEESEENEHVYTQKREDSEESLDGDVLFDQVLDYEHSPKDYFHGIDDNNPNGFYRTLLPSYPSSDPDSEEAPEYETSHKKSRKKRRRHHSHHHHI